MKTSRKLQSVLCILVMWVMMYPHSLTQAQGSEMAVMLGSPEKCSYDHQQKVMKLQEKTSCKPRQQVVQLDLPVSEGVVQVFPSHVSVNRCGGSCPYNPSHSCLPLNHTMRSVDVMIVSSSFSQGQMKTLCMTQQVQEDVSCTCACPLSESSCSSPHHSFHKAACMCTCNNHKDRVNCLSQGKIWDSNTCSCSCSPHTWRLCSTGFLFDSQHSCDCVSTHLLGGVPMLAIVGVVILTGFGLVSSLLFIRKVHRRERQRESLARVLEEEDSGSEFEP